MLLEQSYCDVVVVVGSVLLGLSCHFCCRLLVVVGCLPLLFYLIFFISFGSHGVPGCLFLAFSVRQISPGGVPRYLHLNRVSTGFRCNLLGRFL